MELTASAYLNNFDVSFLMLSLNHRLLLLYPAVYADFQEKLFDTKIVTGKE